MLKSLDFSKHLQNFLIWNEYFGKKNLVQEFMVLGQIFRQVLGSKFCLILNSSNIHALYIVGLQIFYQINFLCAYNMQKAALKPYQVRYLNKM